MSISPKKFQELTEKLSTLQRTKAKAEGALESLMTQLEEEFDCATLKEGRSLLRKLEAENLKLEEEFDGAFKEFREQFDDALSAQE